MFYMQVELHFYPTIFKNFRRKKKNMLREVSLTEQHNSGALELFYFEMNLADRKMPLLYKQRATSEWFKTKKAEKHT